MYWLFLCFQIYFLIDHHCKTKTELIDAIETSQIWMLFRQCVSRAVEQVGQEHRKTTKTFEMWVKKNIKGVAVRVNVWVELGKGCGCHCPTVAMNMHITYTLSLHFHHVLNLWKNLSFSVIGFRFYRICRFYRITRKLKKSKMLLPLGSEPRHLTFMSCMLPLT